MDREFILEVLRRGGLQVGNGIELEAVGLQFEPYRWRPCGVTWDSSRTVLVIKLRRTSAGPALLFLCKSKMSKNIDFTTALHGAFI